MQVLYCSSVGPEPESTAY